MCHCANCRPRCVIAPRRRWRHSRPRGFHLTTFFRRRMRSCRRRPRIPCRSLRRRIAITYWVQWETRSIGVSRVGYTEFVISTTWPPCAPPIWPDCGFKNRGFSTIYRTGEYDFSVDIVVLEILRTQSITTHLCLDVIALIPAPSASQLHTIIIFPALSPRSLCLPLLYPPIWRETALPLVEHNRCCTLAASSFNPLVYLPPCQIDLCPQSVT